MIHVEFHLAASTRLWTGPLWRTDTIGLVAHHEVHRVNCVAGIGPLETATKRTMSIRLCKIVDSANLPA